MRLLLAATPCAREPEPLARMPRRGEHDVFEHGHPRQRARRLKGADKAGARDAVRRTAVNALAVEQYTPALRPQEARDAVEQRRLARPVRPDQAGDRPELDRERRTVDGTHAAEAAHDVLDGKRRCHSSTISSRRPSRPCGRSTTSAMIASPMIIRRRYARSAESRYESGAKSRKRVPANRNPNTTAPTGTAQTRPSPPRITIIQAKKVSSGWKSSGLKNENCQA